MVISVDINGGVRIAPMNQTFGVGNVRESLVDSFELDHSIVAQQRSSGGETLNGVAPFPIPFGAVTHAQFVLLRILNGKSVVVTVTSPAGVLQQISLSGVWLWTAANPNDAITAVTITGAADIEYSIAGT